MNKKRVLVNADTLMWWLQGAAILTKKYAETVWAENERATLAVSPAMFRTMIFEKMMEFTDGGIAQKAESVFHDDDCGPGWVRGASTRERLRCGFFVNREEMKELARETAGFLLMELTLVFYSNGDLQTAWDRFADKTLAVVNEMLERNRKSLNMYGRLPIGKTENMAMRDI